MTSMTTGPRGDDKQIEIEEVPHDTSYHHVEKDQCINSATVALPYLFASV